MSGFTPDWLALREPYDHAARSRRLTRQFVERLGSAPRLVDLGCGSGSNVRYLAPHLPAGQRWLCVDHDPRLLAILKTGALPVPLETLECNLANDLELLLGQEKSALTATALLDLTSAAWLDRLAQGFGNLPLLMTLSFDGRMIWSPALAEDDAINAAFVAHQRQDKGFGAALGADAWRYLADRLVNQGQRVELQQSDWRFTAADKPILKAMVAGVAAAAAEIDPDLPVDIWRVARESAVEAGALSLLVGHVDLLSLPA